MKRAFLVFAPATGAGRVLAAGLWIGAVATAPLSLAGLVPPAIVAASLLALTEGGRVSALVPAAAMVVGTTVPIAATLGLPHALLVGTRALVAVATAIVLVGGIPAAALGPALSGLGLPRAVTATTVAALRRSVLLVEEGRRLVLARRLRGERSRLAGAAVLGALFTRAVERAQRVDLAAALRGSDLALTGACERLSWRDLPVVLLVVMAGSLLHAAPRFFP